MQEVNRKKCVVISVILFILSACLGFCVDTELPRNIIMLFVGVSILPSIKKNSKISIFFLGLSAFILWAFAFLISIIGNDVQPCCGSHPFNYYFEASSAIDLYCGVVCLVIRVIILYCLQISLKIRYDNPRGNNRYLWRCLLLLETLYVLVCIGIAVYRGWFVNSYVTLFSFLFNEALIFAGMFFLKKAILSSYVGVEMSEDNGIQTEKKLNSKCMQAIKRIGKVFKKILITILMLMPIILGTIYLYDCGIIHINYPNTEKYPVRGVDVSNWQGTVSWKGLAEMGIRFAFIKSTEGSTYVDPCFDYNWENAYKTGLRVGAYHFFSFDSAGETQAELFCKTVKQVDNMLPPVIDVEFYGKYKKAEDIDIVKAKKELRILIDILEKEYGMKPLIYCGFLYDEIIKDDFQDCDLWYGLIFNPTFDIKGKSTFWQYSQNHMFRYYNGKEKFIDMNVFMGSEEEFAKYPTK